MRTIIALPALAAALGIVAPVQAESQHIVRHKTVRYQNLDLSTPAGRKALEFRVKHAARTVCDIAGSGSPYIVKTDAECYNRAIAGARQQLAARGIDVRLASL